MASFAELVAQKQERAQQEQRLQREREQELAEQARREKLLRAKREKEEDERQRQIRNLQRKKEKEAAENAQAEAEARKQAQQKAEEERKRALLKDIRGGVEKKTSLLQHDATRPTVVAARRSAVPSNRSASSSATPRAPASTSKPFLTREERNRIKDDMEFGITRPSKEAQKRMDRENSESSYMDLASKSAALSRSLGGSSSKSPSSSKPIPGADHRIPIPPKSKGSASRQIASPASDARALGGAKRDKRSVLEIQRELEEKDARSRGDQRRNGGLFDKTASSRAGMTNTRPRDDSRRQDSRGRDEPSRKSATASSSSQMRRPRDVSPPSKRRRQYASSDSEMDSDDLDSPAPPSRKRRDDERRSGTKIKGPPGMGDIDIFAMITGKSRDYYSRRDIDSDEEGMEASAEQIRREEARAARQAREDDRREEELERRRQEEKRKRKAAMLKSRGE